MFLKESTLFCICHEMFLFCLCPVRSSLDSVLRPFFGVQESLSVRAGRVWMKIHFAPLFESSSLKMHFSSKNTKQKGLWRLKVFLQCKSACRGRVLLATALSLWCRAHFRTWWSLRGRCKGNLVFSWSKVEMQFLWQVTYFARTWW